MGQQVKISRELVFMGAAKHRGNIDGPPIPKVKTFDETFPAATSNDWTEEEDNGCTIGHASVDGGAMTITGSNTANDDCGELLHTAQWSAASNCGMLAKVKISQITETAVCIGLVDQYENLNDHTAMELSGDALRAATNTKDFAGLIFDTDATSSVWYYGTSENGTEGTPAIAKGSLAPVANTYFYVGLQTNTDGDVTFYYGTKIDNMVSVGFMPEAIASASTDLLAPYVGFITRAKGAQVCTVSRIVTWQDN